MSFLDGLTFIKEGVIMVEAPRAREALHLLDCHNCCFLFVFVCHHLWKPFGTDSNTKGLQLVVVFGHVGCWGY